MGFQGLGFGVWGLGHRVWGLGFGFKAWGLRLCRVVFGVRWLMGLIIRVKVESVRV